MTEFSVFYQRTNDKQTSPLCLIQTPKQILSLHLDKILFIESRQKHSIIHTVTEEIVISIPLYRILAQLPQNIFMPGSRALSGPKYPPLSTALSLKRIPASTSLILPETERPVRGVIFSPS